MATAEATLGGSGAGVGLLDRERIVAKAGFNRWLVPPAALCIHLCIGMAYGFSVFWLPLSSAIPGTPDPACKDISLFAELFSTTCNWRVASMGWMFTLFFVVLGVAAALWGGWLERVGPRKAGVVAAFCWAGGLVLGAIAIYVHQLWLLWLGSGIIGGIGLGLGYISPVSTLVKWFPDRRGMATGMAIMGFGGGAMIGSPLAAILMSGGALLPFGWWDFAGFKGAAGPGVWQTFLMLGAGYFCFMLIGAFGYRVPPTGWRPDGWTPPAETRTMITQHQVHLVDAHKTAQFWLIWWVLCLNVSAGIGVIGMASPMLQEIFAGALIGHPELKFNALDAAQKAQIAAIAAGFAGLLSLFNIGGRIFWASMSDYLGRKNTYYTFFILGIVLYASAPFFAQIGNKVLFVLAFGIILSMYGGGFATVPAYLADVFGTQFVGAIHGRLLTAWSTAGIIGPVVVNYIREFQLAAGVPRDHLYDTTMYILCGMLVIGLICNLLVRPLKDKWFMTPDELAGRTPYRVRAKPVGPPTFKIIGGGLVVIAIVWWLAFFTANSLGLDFGCLFYTSDACRAAVASVKGVGGYLAYQPSVLWTGVLCVIVGFLFQALVTPRTELPATVMVDPDKGSAGGSYGIGKGGFDIYALMFWLFVGIPLAWGVWKTLLSAAKIL